MAVQVPVIRSRIFNSFYARVVLKALKDIYYGISLHSAFSSSSHSNSVVYLILALDNDKTLFGKIDTYLDVKSSENVVFPAYYPRLFTYL